MAGIELAQAWVNIMPTTKNMEKEIRKSFGHVESQAQKSGESMGKRLSAGIGKTLKAGAVGAGTAAGAALGYSLKKGFDRLNALDQAKKKLDGLGYSGKEVARVMDGVNDSVTGTAFGLDEAADSAAKLGAVGVETGKDLDRSLSLTADIAAQAGTSMDDISSIMAKVAGAGKLSGRELAQLDDRATGAGAAIAKHLNVSIEEMRDQVSAGEVDFETFQKAMEEHLGGAAQKTGETVSGAFKNMQAALGRVGATLLDGPFQALPSVFGKVTDHIDVVNKKLGGTLELLRTGDFTKEIGVKLAGGDEDNRLFEDDALVDQILNFREKAVETFDTVKEKWGEVAHGFSTGDTGTVFERLGSSIGKIGEVVRDALPSLGRLVKSVGEAAGKAAFLSLLRVLEALAPILEKAVVPAIDKLAGLMEKNQGAVNLFFKAFVGYKSIKTGSKLLGGFSDKAKGLFDKSKKGAGFLKDFGEALKDSWKYAGEAAPNLGKSGKAMLLVKENAKAAGNALTKMDGPIGSAARGFKTLGKAIAANPIGAIVVGISAAVAALTWFFTKTELGQKIWKKFMDFIRPTVDALKGRFSALGSTVSDMWEKYIAPALSAFMAGAKILFAVVATAVLAPLMITWNVMSAAIKAGWENIVKPAWDAMAAAGKWLWDNMLRPVFDAIGKAWQNLTEGIKWYWESVTKPAWEALQWAAKFMWENVLKPTFDLIVKGWQALAGAIKTAWDNIIKPAWDALQWALQALHDNVIKPIFKSIADLWKAMADRLHATWQWINRNVFSAVRTGLDVLKSAFRTAVDGIRTVWDKLRAATAAPVKFVIQTVWNDGIVAAWNKIAGFVPGLDEAKEAELGKLRNFRSGGVLPGYTPGRDVHQFSSPTGGRLALSGGEAIMRPEWTKAVGGPSAVAEMNKRAKTGRFANGGVLKFAGGGVIPAMENIIGKKYPMLVPVYSGYRPGAADHHGSGLAGDFSNGTDNTPEMRALAEDIAKTYPNSLELIHEAPGFDKQIKNGQFVGPGGGSFGFFAGSGNHRNHVHWAMDTPPTLDFGGGVFKGGSGGSGLIGAAFNWMMDKAKKAWDAIVKPIKKVVTSKWDSVEDSIPAKMPGAVFGEIKDKAWDFIKSKIPLVGGGSSSDVDTSGISGAVVDQVKEVFARHGWTGQQWEDAKWIIQQESGWDPTATNPSSGAFGLFQFNPMGGDTLGTYLPDRSTDPAVQANAGARYIKDRYGDPTAARRFWEANHWYDAGGYLKPGATMAMNATGKPEPVFTHEQWQILKSNIGKGVTAKQLEDAIAGALHQSGYVKEAEMLREVMQESSDEIQESIDGVSDAFTDGMLDDALGVFGLPKWQDIPAVKAQSEAMSAIADFKSSGDGDAEVKADFEHRSKNAELIAKSGAKVAAAAANPNPATIGAAGASVGNTIQFIVQNQEAAFTEYKKWQAKESASARGVR